MSTSNEQQSQAQVEFTLSEDDWLALNFWHSENSPALQIGRKSWRFGIPVFWFVCALAAAGWQVSQSDYAWSLSDLPFFLVLLLPIALMAVMWIAFYPRYEHARVRKVVKMMIREGMNKTILTKHRITLSAQGIECVTEFESTTTRWGAVERIATAEGHGFIYLSAISAHIIPKHAFSNEESFERFIETARRFRGEEGK